jgi:uncharacterized membrane protein YcaP (DUF421 family)
MDMWQLAVPALQLVIRSVVIYVILLVGLRLFGKREVGQFTLFDLVLVLLVANAVQPAITGPDTSLTGGLIITVSLFMVNFIVVKLRGMSPWFRRITEGQPTIVIRDGQFIRSAMEREGLSEEECMMALREHGFAKVEEVSLAVLETDGTISVVPRQTEMQKGKRRVRTRRI